MHRHDFYGGGIKNTDTVDEVEFYSLLEADLEPGETVQSVVQET